MSNPLHMIQILITGTSGYIGKYLIEHFNNSDKYLIYKYSRKKDIELLDNECNINNINRYKFDFVINCIGESKKTELMYETNYLDSVNLFENLNYENNPNIIHFSTVAIYNQNVNGKIGINHNIDLDEEYSRTKYIFDKYLLDKSNLKGKIFIFRPSNVYKDSIPGAILKKAYLFNIIFFSKTPVYINWAPLKTIINYINKVLNSELESGTYIINEYYLLEDFYSIFIFINKKKFQIKIPIYFIKIFIKIISKILKKPILLIKYKQLMSKYYFEQ